MAKLTDLPTELLLDIIAELDYVTLHISVRPMCRLFDELIRDAPPSMHAQLFRAVPPPFTDGLDKEAMDISGVRSSTLFPYRKPGSKVIQWSCFELHPYIKKLQFKSIPKQKKIPLQNIGILRRDSVLVPLQLDSRIAGENALRPVAPGKDFLGLGELPEAPFAYISGYSKEIERMSVAEFVSEVANDVKLWDDFSDLVKSGGRERLISWPRRNWPWNHSGAEKTVLGTCILSKKVYVGLEVKPTAISPFYAVKRKDS